MRGVVKGELPQSRLTPRQLPQGGSLWHGGKVFGRVKDPIPEDDFPRTGQILPAPGRNVTAGDKERSRCHASDKKGSSGIVSAMTEGVPERNKRPSEMQLKMPQMVFFCFVNSAHSARRNPIPSAPARSRWRPAQCSCVRCGWSAACRRHRKRQRWSLCPASM